VTTSDSGRAPERSWLSWRRTELSALALAALLFKLGLSRSNALELTAAAIQTGNGVVLYLGRGARRRTPRTVMRVGVIRAVSGCCCLAACFVGLAFL